MTTEFTLHPRLAADTHPVCSLELSQLRLMNDSRYPWLILAPAIPDCREWHHLPPSLAQKAHQETLRVSRCLEALYRPDKINIAALGNLVPQLHIHVIARYCEDDSWPAPVWGQHPALPYENQPEGEAQMQKIISEVRQWLETNPE